MAYPYFTNSSREAFAADKVELRCVYDECCHNCDSRLEEFECRRLSENYGRRFVKCPNYELPINKDDGATMLPFLGFLKQGPEACVFKWLHEMYPQKARECIDKLVRKLEETEAYVEVLKEELLLTNKMKGDGEE